MIPNPGTALAWWYDCVLFSLISFPVSAFIISGLPRILFGSRGARWRAFDARPAARIAPADDVGCVEAVVGCLRLDCAHLRALVEAQDARIRHLIQGPKERS